jgi:hypothetical protein
LGNRGVTRIPDACCLSSATPQNYALHRACQQHSLTITCRMLKALSAALRFELRYGSFLDAAHRAHGMWLTWWRSLGKALPQAQVEKRLQACRSCPLYCAERQTCGDALNPEWLDDRTPMGCFCHLPTKARLTAATCWLDEHTVEPLRWP